MKLFEMRRLPEKAGLATLEFADPRKIYEPIRGAETIKLPADGEAEFFELHKGEQFLFRHTDCYGKSQWWFGGTDERPFLVRLQQEAFRAFQNGGEPGFYEFLKPESTAQFEELFSTQAERQGDIFAVPLPFSWEKLMRLTVLFVLEDKEPAQVKKESVLETRHTITGLRMNVISFGQWSDGTLVQGLLEAPDHSPRELKKGVYFLSQARGLSNPREAD